MLNVKRPTQSAHRISSSSVPDEGLDVAGVVSFLVRRRATIITCTCVVVFLALVHIFTSPAMFTSTATLLIDTRKVQLLNQQSVLADAAIDTPAIESQLEVITSDGVLSNVIRDLNLLSDPQFTNPPQSLLGRTIGVVNSAIRSLFTKNEAKDPDAIKRGVLWNLQSNLHAKRLGVTYAIEIGFRSYTPEKAAILAQAIADAYINDQLAAKYDAAKRASDWLQIRISDLSTQANDAAKRVLDFKVENNIVDTGRGIMVEQQLSEVSSQLVSAKAQVAETRARADRIEEIMKSQAPEATVTDALRNEVVTRLRGQLLDAVNREVDWSARLGSTHNAVVSLRNEIAQLRRALLNELNRIAESFKSDLAVAQAREQAIKVELDRLVGQSQVAGQAQVKLRELDSNAQTLRALYESFLQRYTEAMQQQSFPITEARVISQAAKPSSKSYPQTTIWLSLTLIAGAALGIAIGVLRDSLDRVFRSPDQIEAGLGLECIAVVPSVRPTRLSTISRADSIDSKLRLTVDEPFSRMTESIRTVKVSLDLARIGRSVKVVGVVSSVQGEGKTTVAANLGHLIAQSGQSCLLIDADFRNPGLSRGLSIKTGSGLIDLLSGSARVDSIVRKFLNDRLHVFPAIIKEPVHNSTELLTSPQMRELLKQAGEHYDYVIVDLPPLAPVIDARAISPMIDEFILVVEWGKTHQQVVAETCDRLESAASGKVLGCVLNKANLPSIRSRNFSMHQYYKDYIYKAST